MNNKGFTFTLSKEKIKEFYNSTPQARLKWLEEAQEFVNKAVPPEKLERWLKLQKDTK